MYYMWSYHPFDACDAVVACKDFKHVLLLCTGLRWWGKEMGEEVTYIISKSSSSIFSPCYCLESTALFMAVWHVFP